MRVMITAQDLMNLGLWMKYCDLEGLNYYSVGEGLIDTDELLEVDTEKLKIKIVEND